MQLKLAYDNCNAYNKKDESNKIKLFNTEVYDQIKRFLEIRKVQSEHTANNYERDIRNFFLKTRSKDIEHLTRKDLKFEIDEFEDYYLYLINNKKVEINTANRYITSVKECFRYLHSKKLVDNISFLEIKTFTGNSEQYGVLTMDEVQKMMDLALKQGREDVGLTKYLMIKFAVDTCARLNDCLTIKWSNFVVEEDKVRIRMIGKGNKEFKPSISKEFYNELLQLKKYNNSEYVFNIHRNTVQRMMNRLRKDLNIPKERNITFHSFKKAGVDYIWKQTRDLNQARKAANHSSSKTTEIYIDTDEDYGVMGFFSSEHEVDNELYKKVSHEKLIEAISKLDKGQQMNINLKINELFNK